MPRSSPPDGEYCPVRWSDRQAVAVLPGQFDLSTVDPIREQLLAVINRGATMLIVDMTATLLCDHAGIEALARVHQRAVASGTELRLVITAPVIRQVIAFSGLDRQISIYPTVAAAQPPGSVVPQSPRAASAGPDGVALQQAGLHSVSWLPASDPVSRPGSGHCAEQAARPRSECALTQITNSLFESGLTLQTALDLPPEALRQAAECALDLLDDAIGQTRIAAYAGRDRDTPTPYGTGKPSAAMRPGMSARTGPPKAAGHGAARLSKLVQESQRVRSRSQQLKAQTLEAATRCAATEDQIAATLDQLAASNPRRLPDLRALSEAAANEATRLRQWAHEHAAAG